MAYQSMENTAESRSSRGYGEVDVVDEGTAGSFDEIDGFSASRRGRRGAALTLLLLAVGAVSALSAMRGRSSSQVTTSAATNMATADVPTVDITTPSTKYAELSDDEMYSLFKEFMAKFEKSYKDDEELEMRFNIFRRNLKVIDERNERSQGVVHDVSVWTDMTVEEFEFYQTYGKVSDEAKEYARNSTVPLEKMARSGYCQSCTRFPQLAQYITGPLPKSFDWRDYGAVTRVKNQAYCGSCWAFSTTGCLEGAWYVTGHDKVVVSEQQLVACDTKWNQGCNGGWPILAMVYIMKNGGIVPQHIYPYRKVFMGNLPPPVCSPVVKPGNYAATVGNELSISAMTMNEDVMARWLILNGPLSVALDATGMEYYSEGIDMGELCGDDLDHAVVIVGFGEENGVKYWIIRNSWAIWWGERGYYRLVRGVNACGIAEEVTSITL